MRKKSESSSGRAGTVSSSGIILIPGFDQFGGKQSEASALRNVLAHSGVVSPHTGQPFTEELLFGIGGGIGLGYFVYQSGDFTSLFLATRITSGAPDFLQAICQRIGANPTIQHTSSAAAAEKNLKHALAQGRPPILWVNPMALPYPGTTAGYHTLVAYGFDESNDKVFVADRSEKALTLSRAELAAARQSGDVRKFRALLIEPQAKPPDLRKAVMQGLHDFCEQMQEGFGPPNFKSNFGLSALQKWADLLTNAKDKRGWPKFFPAGPRLFDALASAFDQIENRGGGGSAFRPYYADFLVEAGAILENPEFNLVADQFRDSGQLWHELGEALLPSSVSVFKETKKLSTKKRTLFEKKGMGASGEIGTINTRLAEIRSQVAEDFPLGASEVQTLLADLRNRVLAIHAAEEQAVGALQALVD